MQLELRNPLDPFLRKRTYFPRNLLKRRKKRFPIISAKSRANVDLERVSLSNFISQQLLDLGRKCNWDMRAGIIARARE